MLTNLEWCTRCPCGGDGQADVFIGQLCCERRRKITVSSGGWHDSGDWIPRAQGPAIAGRNRRYVPEHLFVEAEPIGQNCPFRGAREIDEQHEIVADLCGLAGGRTSGRNNVGRHRFNERAGISDGAGFTADHERQRSGLSTADPARNGSVDKAESRLGCRVVKLPRGFNVDGGGIHKKGAGGDRGQHTAFTHIHGNCVLALWQHGEDDLGAEDRIRDATCRCDAVGCRGRERLRI